MNSICDAIAEAMTDKLRNDEFTPHNPAIMRDAKTGDYYYGSGLHADTTEDTVVHNFDELGFCGWEPNAICDISTCAVGLAESIIEA